MATNSDIIRQHIFCQVIYFKTYCPVSYTHLDVYKRQVLDQDQKPVIGPDGKPKTEEVEVTLPCFKAITVFDIEQTTGCLLYTSVGREEKGSEPLFPEKTI